MYEKKLRHLFHQSKQRAEQALDEGDKTAAASYYEQCGDILQEQAKNAQPGTRKQKQELAEEFYELSDNLAGRSDSLQEKYKVKSEDGAEDTGDFSSYVERFMQESAVDWDDVAGLVETKKQLKESFALAAVQDKPEAVEGLHAMMLYGPPGTGKSLLASAVAGSNSYTFFNVKLSQALSKYYGESGKIISSVFHAAREHSPSIVFFDELDAVAGKRGAETDEASRRVLSTLLTELSGFDAANEDVLFMAATNAPWDLDPAVLSRMERLIYVPLPDEATAEEIVRLHTVEQDIELGVDAATIAERCVEEQYSGREIKNLCREAIRRMIDDENPALEDLSAQPMDEIRQYKLQTRPLTDADFSSAFDRITANTDTALLDRYQSWEPA